MRGSPKPYDVNCLHSQQVQPLGLCSSRVWLQLVVLHLSTMQIMSFYSILNGSSDVGLAFV